MQDRSLHLAISAEPLENARSGLGMFVVSGTKALARLRPDWKITLIAGENFQEAMSLESCGVRVLRWDRRWALRVTSQFLRPLVFSSEFRKEIALRVWSHAPVAALRRAGGHLPSIWSGLKPDVVWAPFHSIGTRRHSLNQNLQSLKVPRVMTIHDLHPRLYPQEYNSTLLSDFEKNFCSFARSSQAIITLTPYQKEAIVRQLGIPAERISVIPTPPMLSSQQLQLGEDVSAGSHFGFDKPYFFFPSSQGRTHKNHIRLFLAWKELEIRLGSECPVLVVTQTDPYDVPLGELVHSLELEKRIRLLGGVDECALASLYRGARAVIVPSLYEGGGAGPLAEGILAGKAVLAADIPPFRQQLELYGISGGCWFDPYKVESITAAVLTFLTDPHAQRESLAMHRMLFQQEAELWQRWATDYSLILEKSGPSQI